MACLFTCTFTPVQLPLVHVYCVMVVDLVVSGATFFSLDGIPCASDVGLGSTWEANLRMPAFARWPGRIAPGSISMELVSTLDIFTTGLSLANVPIPEDRVIVRILR